MIDKVLIRMPEDFEFFFPAASVAQNYISQQYYQYHKKQKPAEPQFTIEVGDDSHLFLNSMFPRMEVTMREDDTLPRGEWNCVLDMSDIQRVVTFATPTKKHVTEAWSAMFGASAPKLPIIGPIAVTAMSPKYDFVIDSSLAAAEELLSLCAREGISATIAEFSGRAFRQFGAIAEAKVFVGRRSGASYLAASLQKGCLEVWQISQLWFLDKPSVGYKVLISIEPSAALLLDQIKSYWAK